MTSAPNKKPLPSIRVMILSDAIPNRNGVGTYYHDLMEHLEGEVERAEMIPARANCVFKQSRISLPLPSDSSQHLYLPNVPRILQQVKAEQPTVLIAPTLGPFALLARLIAKYKGIPLVFGYHTALTKLVRLYWRGPMSKLSAWYLKRASRKMFQYAEVVVVNTEIMREEALSLGARRVEVMGTTIASPFLSKPLQSYQGALNTVLFGGRLAKEKRVMRVVEAAAELPDLHFRIAGDGPLMTDLRARETVLPNLTLTGWLERKALLDEIDAADLVVLPSQHESFGSIALEVMARGRLMLVSDQCGILNWPILAPGLCVVHENESVADAIRRLQALSPQARRDKVAAALNAIRHMNQHTMTGWLDLFRTLGAAQTE